jgi:hypothetical protein
MSQSKSIDPERLAALIDGRLDPAQAAAVRAQLAGADDDAVAAFADAIAISGGSAEAIPIGRPKVRRRWFLAVSAAVAAVLIAVLTRTYWQREAARGQFAASVYAAAVPSSAALPPAPVWGSSRGSAAAQTDVGRWVRLGALVTDLEVALARHDTTSQRIADAFAANIEDLPGVGSLPSDIRTFAGATADSSRLEEAVARAAALGDSAFVIAGAWLEAARLASASSDSGFFSLHPADAALASIQKRSAEPTQSAAIGRVLQTVGTRPWNFAALTDTITAALTAIAQ